MKLTKFTKTDATKWLTFNDHRQSLWYGAARDLQP